MATRSSLLSRLPRLSSLSSTAMENAKARMGLRYFSDSIKGGRVLGEEERAAENVYIHKMERERMEKARRLKAEKEKVEAAKAKSSDKKAEEAHSS